MQSSITNGILEKFTTFGDFLRFLRRHAGITQTELAIQVGYSSGQISRLEQNLRLPDIPTLQARFVPALGLEQEPKALAHLLELAANVRREDAPGPGSSPYKGLNFFDETDADLFVGREALTARLTERVLATAKGALSSPVRFLAVVGASGSGKSSLVRAGLVPSLRWNAASADWDIRVLTPTAHPLESLALGLVQEGSSLADSAALIDDLRRDVRSLHLLARQRVESDAVSRLLIILDQFEETFSLCHSEEERAALIGSLMHAASEPGGPVLVVITLRADFYAHCASYPALREALARQQEYIGAMSSEELRRAIEEPARRGRWELEPGLVDLLLHDVGHEPGALPLLSHALLETWDRRRGRRLTLSGYASSGGVRGAIAETAESVFMDQFSPEERAIARRIFLRLTELGDETGTGDTRRRATFKELILSPGESASTQNVLKTLSDARLIITGENSVEVAHEALIREWPTLRGWLEENREGLRLHRHLTEAAQEWEKMGREEDLLYRGARLAQVGEWALSHVDELNALEREYLENSRNFAEHEAREREASRQRELDAAEKLIEIEHRRAEEQVLSSLQLRRRSRLMTGAFLLSVLLLVAALWLGWQARQAGRLAASRELAAAALSNLNVDPERSILLALQAADTSYTLEAEEALHQAVLTSRVRKIIPAHEPGAAVQVTYSPDGSLLATASEDETVRVWEAASGKLVSTLSGHAAAFSPDGHMLATVLSDGTVKLWGAREGTEQPLPGPIDAGVSLEFSPDGSRLATVTRGDLPRIWDLRSAREVAQFPGHTDYVSGVFFSPDGSRLLTASDDGTARVWDATTGTELLRLGDNPTWVWTAAFSPDGQRIATASGSEVKVWDSSTGTELLKLNSSAGDVRALAFSPDTTRLAAGGLDHNIRVWDAGSGSLLLTLYGHSSAVTGLAFHPGGTWLASASMDGTVRIWELSAIGEAFAYWSADGLQGPAAFSQDGKRMALVEGGRLMVRETSGAGQAHAAGGELAAPRSLAFRPDGKQIAVGSGDGKVKLLDSVTGKMLTNLPAHTAAVTAVIYDAQGTHLFTVSQDYKIKLWDIASLDDLGLVYSLEVESGVDSAALSADGLRLAAGLQNGVVLIYDTSSRKRLLSFQAHASDILSVAFDARSRRLVSAGEDGTVRVWDAFTGQPLLELQGHANAVTAVAFSPDGTRIATAGRDDTVRLWEAATGQELLRLPEDGATLTGLAFNAEGTRLAASSTQGVRIYLLKIEELVALARTRATRLLTEAECRKYLHRVTAGCAPVVPTPAPTSLPHAPNGRICQITNLGGLHDDYFNAAVFKGLQSAARRYGWTASALESISTPDFQKNMNAFKGADCRLIVSLYNLRDVISGAAQADPGQKFLAMDFTFDPPPGNVWMQTFATDQAAFLAGYAAAAVTRTGKVGMFGGVDIPQVTDFMDGFSLGVEYFNLKNQAQVEVLGWDPKKHEGLFLGGFCCSTEGRQLTKQLLFQGADVILPVAGQSVGWGAGAEVQDHGAAWLIGVDTDWVETFPGFSNVLLTSIEKRFDISVEQVSAAVMEGTFAGGVHVGTLATGEVSLAPFHDNERLISDQVRADLEQITRDIVAGRIRTHP